MKYKELNRAYYLKIEIDAIKKSLKEITIISGNNYSLTPHGTGTSNPTERIGLLLMNYKSKLESKEEEYIKELISIENFIEKIDDPKIRLIARLRFIDFKSWEEIGKEIYNHRTTPQKQLNQYLRQAGVDFD